MDIQTQSADIAGGTPGLSGYLAYPAGNGAFPGIVVIHEAFGLNDDIREITARLAGEGYAALAVDLFAGRSQVVCMFRFFGSMLFNSLHHNGINDLRAALTYLQNQPMVSRERLGALGFCLGGNFAISWACTENRLKVVAPFYSLNPRPLDAVARACPVIGSYPEKDFTAGAGRRLEAALEQHGVPHDIKVYPGATHSFFNGRKHNSADNQAAADDAWRRVLAYFREHLA